MAKATKRVTLKKCQCCGNDIPTDDFYKSFSPMYKHEGLLPICKNCVIATFDENLQIYRDMEKALYKTLFSLDVFFDIKLAKKCVLDTFDSEDKHVIKAYFSRINLLGKGKTAKDSEYYNIWDIEREGKIEIENVKAETVFITKEMINRWSEGRPIQDYVFLENQYDTMKQTYGDKNPYSLSCYEQIAQYRLLLKKEWDKSNPNSKVINDINASISRIANDCNMKQVQLENNEDDNLRFSKFIEMIEMEEPILNDVLYNDVDGIRKVVKEDFIAPFATALDIDYNGKKLKRKRKAGEDVDKK